MVRDPSPRSRGSISYQSESKNTANNSRLTPHPPSSSKRFGKRDDESSAGLSGIDPELIAEDSTLTKAVSFLSGDSVRWMNKRQPHTKHPTRTRVQPSRALQLREVFRGLDYDNSGSIDIDELQEAVRYVCTSHVPGEEPPFKDPEKLMDFFKSMDANGDGTVDFNEFLVALTSQASSGDGDADRLHQAFFDFANQHRRQRILDFVKEKGSTDLDKYRELRKLFTIQYFREDPVDMTMQDRLNRVQKEAAMQMKELHSAKYMQQRRQEQYRAREAALFFQHQRRSQSMRENIRRNPMPGKKDTVISLVNEQSAALDAELVNLQVEKKIRKRFAMFSMHDENTFTPDETVIESLRPQNIRRMARQEADNVKHEKYLVSNLPPILPPISVRQRAIAANAESDK
jgi:Ca2+-binding EF-hand superfamily protein